MSTRTRETPRRKYHKRRRAELEDETRLRITEAAVDLHGSVGPARTTISAVAARAGVQRATVYRHFPSEEALFGACSAHWLAQHPLPDLDGWAACEAGEERLRMALSAVYRWYETAEEMLEKTTRDAPLVPAMRPAMEGMGAWLALALETIVRGRPERGARRRKVEAAIGHALSFFTWRSLAREQGLSRSAAVELMCGLVGVAAKKQA